MQTSICEAIIVYTKSVKGSKNETEQKSKREAEKAKKLLSEAKKNLSKVCVKYIFKILNSIYSYYFELH